MAKANDIELNYVEAERGNATAEHLKANGLGKIPAFVGEDGFTLSECIAIAIYSKLTCTRYPAWHHFFFSTPSLANDDLALFYTVIPV